jgi:hypothetical protein
MLHNPDDNSGLRKEGVESRAESEAKGLWILLEYGWDQYAILTAYCVKARCTPCNLCSNCVRAVFGDGSLGNKFLIRASIVASSSCTLLLNANSEPCEHPKFSAAVSRSRCAVNVRWLIYEEAVWLFEHAYTNKTENEGVHNTNRMVRNGIEH